MKFLSRLLMGLFLTSATLSILIFAGGQLMTAVRESDEDGGRRSFGRERVFAANVETLTSTTIAPVISTYGTVISSRSVEIRASVGGMLVALSPHFRNGGQVASGELVFQVDPANLQSSLAVAESQMVEALAELTAARAALELAQAEVEISETQRRLRMQALTREISLEDRGIGTGVAVEAAEQSLASAEQALLNQNQALAQADTRIWRAEATVVRSDITLKNAQRSLEETRVIAPFEGVLSDVSGVLGRLVSGNEKLAVLIDPTAMEVEFRLSYNQFSRLVDEHGQVRHNKVKVIFGGDDNAPEIDATIVRIGAEVGEGQTGRLLYAKLDRRAAALLIPGDFLSIRIPEQALENVAQIPASAVGADGMVLLLGEDDRLEEVPVNVLRQQGDVLIVNEVPFGREFIVERAAQLGSGIQVRPLRKGDETEAPEVAAAPAPPATIALDEERRAKLIAFIDANQRMPADAKARTLAQLNAPETPVSVVERLESRMGR